MTGSVIVNTNRSGGGGKQPQECVCFWGGLAVVLVMYTYRVNTVYLKSGVQSMFGF